MKITADSNVLVRLFVDDDETQSQIAFEVMRDAEIVAISLHSLCEVAWVLRGVYAWPGREIARAIRGLAETRNAVFNRAAVSAGLAMLDAGGDFADGVIAYDGAWLGGGTFVSFDRKAVRLLTQAGIAARVPA